MKLTTYKNCKLALEVLGFSVENRPKQKGLFVKVGSKTEHLYDLEQCQSFFKAAIRKIVKP
jgi:hypothetical protein